MSGFGSIARALSSTAVRFFGGDRAVTLRRRHTLKLQSTGDPVSTLRISAGASAGAVTLSLKGSTGGSLRGTLISGAQLTIAGDATVYTVGADADTSTSGVLAGVTISPALAAGASADAVVTIATPYADRSLWALRAAEEQQSDDRGRQVVGVTYHLVGDDLTPPAFGDLLIDGSDTLTITGVRPVSPGGSAARWTVSVGVG